MPYLPSETHKTLYVKISKMICAGRSYLEVAKILLPDIDPYKAKGVIYRGHKKFSWTKDNEIRMKLGLPKFLYVQDDPTKTTVSRCSACGKAHNIDRACQMEVTVKPKSKPKPAWVTEAADNLARLEQAARPNPNRTYNRKGKRVT